MLPRGSGQGHGWAGALRFLRGTESTGDCRPLPVTYFVFSGRFRRAGTPRLRNSQCPGGFLQVSPAGGE